MTDDWPRPESLTRYMAWQPNPQARASLLAFSNAGAGVATLYAWLRGLPPWVHLCPVLLPGRESRFAERPFTRVPPLVDTLATALEPSMERPYVLFGHSFGATLSFELARLRQRRGLRGPSLLVISARSAPHLARTLDPIAHLPEPEFIQAIRERYNALPDVVAQNRDMLDLFLPPLRADMAAFESYAYAPGPLLTCPLLVLGGTRDPVVRSDDLEEWSEHTTSWYEVRRFEGDHFFVKDCKAEVQTAIVEAVRRAIPESLTWG